MTQEKKLPELIFELRDQMRVSQSGFALMAGVQKESIYRYEKGKNLPEPPVLARIIQIAEEKAPDIAAPLRDEYRRLFGASLNGSQLTPEREALLSSLRALLANEHHARKVSDKLLSILLDMQEKGQNVVAPRKKAR